MYVFVYDTSIYIVYEVEEERAVVMFVDKFLLLRPQSTHFDCIYIDDIYIYAAAACCSRLLTDNSSSSTVLHQIINE